MQAEKAAPAPHLPPRNKEEGGREGGRRIMTTKKQKNRRSRDRLFVYKQTRDQGKKKCEFRRIGFCILEEQSTTIFGRIQNTFGEENCTY
jgi:thermostable 8-oxoguanine DNA glycosylase